MISIQRTSISFDNQLKVNFSKNKIQYNDGAWFFTTGAIINVEKAYFGSQTLELIL